MADKQQEQFQKILLDLLNQPENKECADCGGKGPRWASASLGIFVCIKCSGIHRSMGTHISFVRSVSLDRWNAEQVKNMQRMGNGRAKEIYECLLPDNFRRPNENDTYALEQFIRAKYERKQYMKKDAEGTTTRRRPKQKKSETPATRPPPSNLISLADEPAAEEWNFQGASHQSSHVPTLAPPKGTVVPSGKVDSSDFGDFTAATPSLTPQSFDAADAFFSSTPTTFPAPSTPSGPTAPNSAASKDSILQLFGAPHAASFGASPLPSHSSHTHGGPNYNVSLPGLGLPATPTGMPHNGVYNTGNHLGMQNMGMQNNMGMYNASMGNGGYNNMGMGMGMGMARPMGTPGVPTNFVNTNGYVNAKWMSSQSGGQMYQ